MADNIKCTNCGFNGLVSTASEVCPVCKVEGCLSWKENEPQEIEHPMDKDSVLCPICSCQLNHMDKNFQIIHINECEKD